MTRKIGESIQKIFQEIHKAKTSVITLESYPCVQSKIVLQNIEAIETATEKLDTLLCETTITK